MSNPSDAATNQGQSSPSSVVDSRADEIKILARDYGELAIHTLVDVCRERDPETGLPVNPGAARAVAARTLLQAGDLLPERRQQKRVDHHIYDERQAHLAALQRLSAPSLPARPQTTAGGASEQILEASWEDPDGH